MVYFPIQTPLRTSESKTEEVALSPPPLKRKRVEYRSVSPAPSLPSDLFLPTSFDENDDDASSEPNDITAPPMIRLKPRPFFFQATDMPSLLKKRKPAASEDRCADIKPLGLDFEDDSIPAVPGCLLKRRRSSLTLPVLGEAISRRSSMASCA